MVTRDHNVRLLGVKRIMSANRSSCCIFKRTEPCSLGLLFRTVDDKEIGNKACSEKTKGALLIRNSWGRQWGDNGYGWLPYEYVLQGLALDFWSILSMEMVETKQFGL